MEKKAHSSGGEARAYAFHLFKYFMCFACVAIEFFLAVRVIESQFAGLSVVGGVGASSEWRCLVLEF